MIRFLLSLIIITLIIVYLIAPLYKYIVRFFKREAKRINNNFNIDNKKSKVEKEKI